MNSKKRRRGPFWSAAASGWRMLSCFRVQAWRKGRSWPAPPQSSPVIVARNREPIFPRPVDDYGRRLRNTISFGRSFHSHLANMGLIVLSLFGLAVTLPAEETVSPVEGGDGYFLSLRQKGELIVHGRITDGDGNLFEIKMVPGYRLPVQRAGKYIGKSGDSLMEYFGSEKYGDLGDSARDAFKWGHRDCWQKFAWRGSSRAWRDQMARAAERSRKRVFGWWLAYPWAITRGTIETTARVPLGATGALLGTVAGGVIVPGYYLTDSAVKSTAFLAGGAVIGPVAATAWNTAFAPPMALLGQRPALERVDGYWVKLITHEETESAKRRIQPPTPEELDALALWGRGVLREAEALDLKRREAEKRRTEGFRAVRERHEDDLKAIADEERARMAALAGTPEVRDALACLAGFNRDRIPYALDAIVQRMRDHGESSIYVARLRELRRNYPPSDR